MISGLRLYRYSCKLIKKALAVILVGAFLSSSCLADQNNKLAPSSKLNNENFKYPFTVGAICKHIEHDGNLDDKAYLSDVLARLDTGKNHNIAVLPHEIIIEIPSESLAVRYFDPTKTNIITPYSDISKLSTKVIGPRLHRQIIHRTKALSLEQIPAGINNGKIKGIFEEYKDVEVRSVDLLLKNVNTGKTVYLVETTQGKFVLSERTLRVDPQFFIWEYTLMDELRARGFLTAPQIYKTKNGKIFAEKGSGFYTLYEYKAGEKAPWGAVSIEKLLNAAKTQAKYHNAVQSIEPRGRELNNSERQYPLGDILNVTDMRRWFYKARDALPEEIPDRHRNAIQYFRSHFDLLESQFDKIENNAPPEGYASLPQLIVHGDYNPNNLLFIGDDVSGLIDFEYTRKTSRLMDLANGFIEYLSGAAGSDRYKNDSEKLIGYLRAYQVEVSSKLTVEELKYLPEAFRAYFLEGISMVLAWCHDKDSVTTEQYIIQFINANISKLRALDESIGRGDWQYINEQVLKPTETKSSIGGLNSFATATNAALKDNVFRKNQLDLLIKYVKANKAIDSLELREYVTKAFPELNYSRSPVPHKLGHVLAVIQCLNRLINEDFDYFYKTLCDRAKGKKFELADETSRIGYVGNIKRLHSFYSMLTDEQKDALIIAVILHDIGYTEKNTTDAEHPVRGAELARQVLKYEVASKDILDGIGKIITYHDTLGNIIRGKKVPRLLRGFSDEFLKILCIVNAMDMAGYGAGTDKKIQNNLIPSVLRDVLEFADSEKIKQLDDEEKYYEYRLKKLARKAYGTELSDNEFEQLKQAIEKNVPKETRESFYRNWNSRIEVRETSLFFGITKGNAGGDSYEPAAKFFKFVALAAENYFNNKQGSEADMFIVDADIDNISKEEREYLFKSLVKESGRTGDFHKLPIIIEGNHLTIRRSGRDMPKSDTPPESGVSPNDTSPVSTKSDAPAKGMFPNGTFPVFADGTAIDFVKINAMWKGLWSTKLLENTSYWKTGPTYSFPYNANAPSVAYDPKAVPQKAIGPFRQFMLSEMPENHAKTVTRENLAKGIKGSNLLNMLETSILMTDPFDSQFAIVINRWPKTNYHSLLLSKEWQPQRLTRAATRSLLRWVKCGAVFEFHKGHIFVNHLHPHLFPEEEAPVFRYGKNFIQKYINKGLSIGTLKGYPIFNIALTAENLSILEEAVVMFSDKLDKNSELYNVAGLRNPETGAVIVVFFFWSDKQQDLSLNPTGTAKIANPNLTEGELFKELKYAFLGEKSMASKQDSFWKIWSSVDSDQIAEDKIAYIARNKTLFKDILGEDKSDILVRVPIEAIESIGVDNIKDFLATFQSAPNGHVELYYMSGTGEVNESIYQRYGLEKKSLSEGFKKTRENTVTLFPSLKGEEINQSAIISRLGDVNVTPEDTILSPIGLQHDPAGLIRATILGLKMMDIARQVKAKGIDVVKDQTFKDKIQLEILEQLKNVCDADDLKNFNLTSDDIIALAIGNINNIITSLKKLIRLLPITPINAEELRQIYEHAKAVITAA